MMVAERGEGGGGTYPGELLAAGRRVNVLLLQEAFGVQYRGRNVVQGRGYDVVGGTRIEEVVGQTKMGAEAAKRRLVNETRPSVHVSYAACRASRKKTHGSYVRLVFAPNVALLEHLQLVDHPELLGIVQVQRQPRVDSYEHPHFERVIGVAELWTVSYENVDTQLSSKL